MSILDVIYRVAHNYPGGIKTLAVRMGKNAAVLQNKINPNNDSHHVTAEEAAEIADLADCDEIAKAFAERRNMLCISAVKHQGLSDVELLDLVIQANASQSELLQDIQKAMADGRVDRAEFELIHKDSMQHMEAIAELTSRIEGMVQDKPVVRVR